MDYFKLGRRASTKRNTTLIGMMVGALSIGITAQAQTICAFDLGGASGANFAIAKDYVLAAKKWNMQLVLKAYGDEELALQDFKNNQCDALFATSFVTRQFNSYTGSINAIGAIPSNVIARNLLTLMGNPRLAADMVEGEYEAAGMIPIGSAYLVVKDRTINTLAKIEGKRLGILKVDSVQKRMASKVGAKPVEMTINNAGQKFKAGDIDILPSPSFGFSALEVYRSMGPDGGIARFPLSFMTGNLIIKPANFPTGFGQRSRSWFAEQTPRFMTQVNKYDSSVPEKLWFDISAQDQVGYLKILRQMRIEFVHNKTYNPRMMNLLKKLRCQQDPRNYECSLKDE